MGYDNMVHAHFVETAVRPDFAPRVGKKGGRQNHGFGLSNNR